MEQQLLNFSSKATTNANHPQTSKDAANALNNSGAIPQHENDILKALRQHPGSTAKRLGAEMARKWLQRDAIYLSVDMIEKIIYIASQPHKRLAQMGDRVRIENAKGGNKYYVI